MKTFTQFNEDIEQRRQQLRQRQLDQMAAHRERVKSYQAAQAEKRQAAIDREEEHQEIIKKVKKEL